MKQYSFAANIDNKEEVRRKEIRKANIWSLIVLCLPIPLFFLPENIGFTGIAPYILTGVIYGVPVILYLVNNQNHDGDFRFQTRLPGVVALPLSLVAVYIANIKSENLREILFSPWWFLVTLLTICAIHLIVVYVYRGILQTIDADVSPNKLIQFTTRITGRHTHTSKNSTTYYIEFMNHELESDSYAISSTNYGRWKDGDVLMLYIRPFVINEKGAVIKDVKHVSNFSGETDAEQLHFQKTQYGDLFSEDLQKTGASGRAGCAFWVIGVVSWIVYLFFNVESKYSLEYARQEYVVFLIPIVALVLFILWRVGAEIREISGDYAYEVWKDKFSLKLCGYTLALSMLASLGVVIYNRTCSPKERFTETYSCRTEERYHSTKHGHYYTYHAILDCDKRQKEIEINGSEMGAKSIAVTYKKGLFGVPVIHYYEIER